MLVGISIAMKAGYSKQRPKAFCLYLEVAFKATDTEGSLGKLSSVSIPAAGHDSRHHQDQKS